MNSCRPGKLRNAVDSNPVKPRSVQMLDLKAEYGLMRERIRAVVDEVLESQQHIGGPAIAQLEATIARRIGVAHAIAVSSGTDAMNKKCGSRGCWLK